MKRPGVTANAQQTDHAVSELAELGEECARILKQVQGSPRRVPCNVTRARCSANSVPRCSICTRTPKGSTSASTTSRRIELALAGNNEALSARPPASGGARLARVLDHDRGIRVRRREKQAAFLQERHVLGQTPPRLVQASSTEWPTPVKPSRSGEKNPKKLGSSVASITNEYCRSVIGNPYRRSSNPSACTTSRPTSTRTSVATITTSATRRVPLLRADATDPRCAVAHVLPFAPHSNECLPPEASTAWRLFGCSVRWTGSARTR